MPYKNPAEKVAYNKKYREENKVRLAAQYRRWQKENKERVNQYARDYRRKNLETVRASGRRHKEKLKEEVLSHYGGKCVCCGVVDFAFLYYRSCGKERVGAS